jgi:hypothetical protein
MKSHMNLKTTSSRVAFITASKSTSEWFLAGVCEFMSLKMSLCDELAFTNVTSEWTFPCVCSHVSF